MRKNERISILCAIEGIAASIKNGDFPAMEASSPLTFLCELFSSDELMDGIDDEYYEILQDFGGLTPDAADGDQPCPHCGAIPCLGQFDASDE